MSGFTVSTPSTWTGLSSGTPPAAFQCRQRPDNGAVVSTRVSFDFSFRINAVDGLDSCPRSRSG